MIHLNTHLLKRNENLNKIDDWFEHTLINEKWRCRWSRWFIWKHIYQGEMNYHVNDVDNSFEHTLTKEKWRCRWSRWFIWTHTYQREMKM